jgi:hypothetical protein
VLVCKDKNFVVFLAKGTKYDMLLFVFIIHLGNFLCLGIDVVTVWYIM